MPALFHALFLLLAVVGLSFAAPAQLTLMDASSSGDASSFFNCPSFTVRCVKDNKWPSGIVGNVSQSRVLRSFASGAALIRPDACADRSQKIHQLGDPLQSSAREEEYVRPVHPTGA